MSRRAHAFARGKHLQRNEKTRATGPLGHPTLAGNSDPNFFVGRQNLQGDR